MSSAATFCGITGIRFDAWTFPRTHGRIGLGWRYWPGYPANDVPLLSDDGAPRRWSIELHIVVLAVAVIIVGKIPKNDIPN